MIGIIWLELRNLKGLKNGSRSIGRKAFDRQTFCQQSFLQETFEPRYVWSCHLINKSLFTERLSTKCQSAKWYLTKRRWTRKCFKFEINSSHRLPTSVPCYKNFLTVIYSFVVLPFIGLRPSPVFKGPEEWSIVKLMSRF